jgi:hypothetical protein
MSNLVALYLVITGSFLEMNGRRRNWVESSAISGGFVGLLVKCLGNYLMPGQLRCRYLLGLTGVGGVSGVILKLEIWAICF